MRQSFGSEKKRNWTCWEPTGQTEWDFICWWFFLEHLLNSCLSKDGRYSIGSSKFIAYIFLCWECNINLNQNKGRFLWPHFTEFSRNESKNVHNNNRNPFKSTFNQRVFLTGGKEATSNPFSSTIFHGEKSRGTQLSKRFVSGQSVHPAAVCLQQIYQQVSQPVKEAIELWREVPLCVCQIVSITINGENSNGFPLGRRFQIDQQSWVPDVNRFVRFVARERRGRGSKTPFKVTVCFCLSISDK